MLKNIVKFASSLGVASKRRISGTLMNQMKNFWSKNALLNRPMSPWIIYSFKIPMMASISHRIAGFTAASIALVLPISLIVFPGGAKKLSEILIEIDIPAYLRIPIKFAIIFPLVYHGADSGKRMLRDFGYGATVSTQTKLSILMFVVALMITSNFINMSEQIKKQTKTM
ncbi:Succinate dehydrogenase cytochrome b560 subunit, mitochondrial [Intoshia linei]|uniref:Succinate dehydrogenase cytochrome b560 subunit, mitochondrial n=1 Tax=Intoshia linei TaxID=1819745 RepID=A0A177B3Y2_9BILA|nr:Succinate dehydrogenase cytochrome b560 subunit, mitochondrial [Intoshia linei]